MNLDSLCGRAFQSCHGLYRARNLQSCLILVACWSLCLCHWTWKTDGRGSVGGMIKLLKAQLTNDSGSVGIVGLKMVVCYFYFEILCVLPVPRAALSGLRCLNQYKPGTINAWLFFCCSSPSLSPTQFQQSWDFFPQPRCCLLIHLLSCVWCNLEAVKQVGLCIHPPLHFCILIKLDQYPAPNKS